MHNTEINRLLSQLNKKELTVFDIPEEYQNNSQIISLERKLGLRTIGKRGFDVISNTFFVEEELTSDETQKKICSSFNDFGSFFDFLEGDVYENACYAFYSFPQEIIVSHKLDMRKLKERKSFIMDSIDKYTLSPTKQERERYKGCLQWAEKFNACKTDIELKEITQRYAKSKAAEIVNIDFFLFQYIFYDFSDKQRISAVLEYVYTHACMFYKAQRQGFYTALYIMYSPNDILNAIDLLKNATPKQKKDLKKYFSKLKDKRIRLKRKGYFDKITHFYCEKIEVYKTEPIISFESKIYRYFKTFQEFVEYRKGDLRFSDLSGDIGLRKEDFSACITDSTTKLPIFETKINYSLKKYYCKGSFYIKQQWKSDSGSILKEFFHTFRYFFDFASFLKGDLSDSDFILCDGLKFLTQWEHLDFTNAKMQSHLCEKFGLDYDLYNFKANLVKSFTSEEYSLVESASTLNFSLCEEARNMFLTDTNKPFILHDFEKVYYISDIHILHAIKETYCRSKEDVIYIIKKIVNNIAEDINQTNSLLLIGGDISSDFEIFQIFVKQLSFILPKFTTVVFTLGNHELWSFQGVSLDKIVEEYRKYLDQYGMYLLQNDILYKDKECVARSSKAIQQIKYNDLCEMSNSQISELLRSSRYVIVGGLGFSGYNYNFNADNGIYQQVINRETEIVETKKFENLYNRLIPILANKNCIVLTHTPKKDWCRIKAPDKNFVYISGHTHKNYFYDNGEHRVYCDNQIGYHNHNPHLKSLLISNKYDCFADYKEGLYKITREQYRDFYRGKNLSMTFQREVNELYMLKRSGYYCFICKSKDNTLNILNGGSLKKLKNNSIDYYYNSMMSVINTLNNPLVKFTEFQNRIAAQIKSIGGDGTIHGCIIDIDALNHIYVNPLELTTTGYWALNMEYKILYPSIPALLKDKCPQMFKKYLKEIQGNKDNVLIGNENKAMIDPLKTDLANVPQLYLDTEMYKASREICKIQKLHSNILCAWLDEMPQKNTQIKQPEAPKNM